MIDPHVHLRDWEEKDKETLSHGLALYKMVGFTDVFDMPNTKPAITGRDLALDRLALASKANREGISYHLYLGLTNDKEQIKEMVSTYNELFPLIIGLKLFLSNSTGNMGITKREEQERVLNTLKEANYNGVLVVHAEKESEMKNELSEKGKWDTHSLSRPNSAEVEAIKDIIDLALKTRFEGHLHIAHISTKKSVEIVKENKKNLSISMGATPHHALLNKEYAFEYDSFLKMNPPLRDEEDRAFIFSSLLDGTIDFVESDHAPHTLLDKKNGSSGIPNIVGLLLLLEELRKAGATKNTLENLFAFNAAKIFKLEVDDALIPEDIKPLIKKIEKEYEFNPYKSFNKGF